VALFDILKDTVFRRGRDDPLLRKGMERVSDVLAQKQRERVSSRWPLASDPDGTDIFVNLTGDEDWALQYFNLSRKEFRAQRYDGIDASGWRIGRGSHVGIIDVDMKSRAGSDGREHNDCWLEALHEPIFGFVAFAAYPEVWLEDVQEHQRYTPVADEIPELQRYFYTGRFRASGEWCGLAHLDPLVLRVRLDTHDASRQRTEMVFTSVLKRLDVEAFLSWRSRVRPASTPAVEPVPREARALPHPDHIREAVRSGGSVDPELVLDEGALSAALGGRVEQTQPFHLAGVSGVRYLATGGRAFDVVRLDEATATALRASAIDGADVEIDARTQGRLQFATISADTDGALRWALLRDDGATFLLRARGVKRGDSYRVVQVAIDHLG
jgi:hypothetical protein